VLKARYNTLEVTQGMIRIFDECRLRRHYPDRLGGLLRAPTSRQRLAPYLARPAVANRLAAMRGPGESYTDVIVPSGEG
jgi:hypothetical protein